MRVSIRNLSVGDRVGQAFAVRSASAETTKGRSSYLTLALADSTGDIEARLWDASPSEVASCKGWRFVHMAGSVNEWNGRLQIRADSVRPIDADEETIADLVPSAPLPLHRLQSRFDEIVAQIRSDWLREVVTVSFAGVPAGLFETLPAAMTYHHAVRHGLIQHTVEVAEIAGDIADRWASFCYGTHRGIDRPLVLAGALLHDIGKIDDYEGNGLTWKMSESGGLLGHIVKGVGIVSRAIAAQPTIDERLGTALLHIIVSHHQKQEHGSPEEPKSPEAVIVSLADQASATLEPMMRAVPVAGEHFVKLKTGKRVWTGGANAAVGGALPAHVPNLSLFDWNGHPTQTPARDAA